MNIFYLDSNPANAAVYHCDKHVVKMIVETAQLLSTAHHVLDGDDAPEGIYKSTHVNHPCAKWVRKSKDTYAWTYSLLVWLLYEYENRYDKKHKTLEVARRLHSTPKNLTAWGWYTPALAMPVKYHVYDPVQAYRLYYMIEKRDICQWNRGREAPSWWPYE